MRLGIIQTSPVFGAPDDNRRELEKLIVDLRADLWVAPELALTGYEFRSRDELFELAEEIPGGETCAWLIDCCRRHNAHIVLGLAERDGDRVHNTAVLADGERIIGRYRKLHLFDREHGLFDRGNLPLPVYDIGWARVGLMICFDWRFPEAARALALRGAQVLAHPSNLVLPYGQDAMITRALENRVFCATANRIGREDRAGREVRFTGGSVVIDPDGGTLIRMSRVRPEAEVVDIEPARADDKRVNPYNDVLADRRPEYYLNDPPAEHTRLHNGV